MKKIQIIIFISNFCFTTFDLLAQVDTAWVRRYDGPGNNIDAASALAVDNIGNVYVTGYSWGGGTWLDYATIKYAPDGDTVWVRRYNGPGNGHDYARALVVDDSGNVYVTGTTDTDTSLFIDNIDYATIKYAPNGDTLWVRLYGALGNGNDEARAIVVDGSGNVYVTGGSAQSSVAPYNSDYATIKYGPNGDTLWIRRYNGPENYNDEAIAIAVDGSGNVFVTGSSPGNGTSYDYVTVKYSPNGDTLWVRRYNGPGSSHDEAIALAVDDSGNVYVTGSDWGNGTASDYATIKYGPNGDTLWVRRYNGPWFYDYPTALAVDYNGNVHVTGYSEIYTYEYNYATVKYAPNGDTLWVRRYNAAGNHDDMATALAVDDSGNVYVAGVTDAAPLEFASDYATIKYAPNGDTLWVRRYNGPEHSADYATDLTVDDGGNVYVTGASYGSGAPDYATIMYIQYTCIAKPGDANGDNKILLSDIVTVINFLFKSQPAPNPSCRGDANADGNILLSDIVYLINFLFKSSSTPVKSKECCL